MKKNFIISVFSSIGLLMAGACSDDTLNQGQNQGSLDTENGGNVFMSIDFKMPSADQGTRSETTDNGGSTGGVEIGQATENNVSSALIVLASTESKEVNVGDSKIKIEEYGYIVAGEVRNNHISYLSNSNGAQFRATAKLNKANLNTLYGMYEGNVPEMYVFVFCNPTKDLTDLFANADTEGGLAFGSANWIDMTCEVIQGHETKADKNIGIWSANSFLMNNKELTKRLLPKKLLDWENYNSYDNAFKLSDNNPAKGSAEQVDNGSTGRGAVLVERSVARFDFKDGSPGNNTYNVLFLSDEDGNEDETAPIVAVQIQKMCLVNMGNKFYYLPRVSANGQMTPGAPGYELCGREKPWSRSGETGQYVGGNYVVGPWANVFASFNMSGEFDFYDYLNYPFFNNDGTYNNAHMAGDRWDVAKVEDVLKGVKDNYEGKATADGEKDEVNKEPRNFRIWRYVVENVIPGNPGNPGDPAAQKNGISTGVVFKAKLTGTSKALEDNLNEEYWEKGYAKNLANCLDGKEFIYNGVTQTSLKGNSKDDPILYYFNGHIYMGWRHIRQAAIQASITQNVSGQLEINRSTSLYKAVFGDGPIPLKYKLGTEEHDMSYIAPDGKEIVIADPMWDDDTSSDAYKNYMKSANYAWTVWSDNGKGVIDVDQKPTQDLINMRSAVTAAGITIYQSSNDNDYKAGYYCYYYYWNRHNDNNIPGTMGPMEFDVVRNNVYKLYIDKISRLGHPRISENDPDNPTPNTPDESDDIYLDVKLEIVPWVVRLNSISF